MMTKLNAFDAPPTRKRWFLICALVFQLSLLLLSQSGMVSRYGAKSTDDVLKQNSQLFVYVSGWMEGMSSWMISLSEILVLCKELNATFVEPCITKGRLCSCANRGENPVRLSHILDFDRLRDYHSDIATFEDFQLRMNYDKDNGRDHWVRICMHHFSPRSFCGDAPLVYGAKNIPQIDAAVWSAQRAPTTLEIKRYGRYGFRKSEWVSDKEAAIVKRDFLRLAPSNFQLVDQLLQKMGIEGNDPFSVIHWRAEIPNINYMTCAKRIIEARNMMKLNHSVILMSSLNMDATYSWAGAKNLAENTTSNKALKKLLGAGFLKLDQVVDYEKLPDSIMFAVYDLILAMRATEFVTCSKGCRDNSVCAACNWRGQFAGLAVSLRREVEHKSSVECWPSIKGAKTLGVSP